MKPTWDELRKRSEINDAATGRSFFCSDCYFMFKSGGWGCRKHTLASEVDERDAAINGAMSRMFE